MRIFVTGATGFMGSRLTRALLCRGDRVVALTRDHRRAVGIGPVVGATEERLELIEGDPTRSGPWQRRLAGCDAVVALAGERIFGGRLSAKHEERVLRSRVEGLRRIVEALENLSTEERPAALLSASSFGYYPDRGGTPQTEAAPPGDAFLARLSVRWEEEAGAAERLGVRVVLLRFGLVLASDEGALGGLVPVFRALLGGSVGSGKQYLPWIHVDDSVGGILFCLDNDEARGPINLTAPGSVPMGEFARALGRVLGRPAALRLPGFLVRALAGEGADALLGSRRVLPRRVQELGYGFRFPALDDALVDLVSDKAAPP